MKGESPASLVYEDERVSAFLTIEPVNPGHLLIVPKRHATYLNDLEPENVGHILIVAARVASAIRKSKLRLLTSKYSSRSHASDRKPGGFRVNFPLFNLVSE